MARSINQVILMGRLTRDPEQRTTSTGKIVVSFSLAVDRAGQDDSADFFDITAWEKLGELVVQYLSKGRRVLVQGRLRQDSWDDKDTGKKRSRVEVTATDVTFLDGPSGDSGNSGGSNGSNNATEKSAPAAKKTNKKSDDVVIDDIDDKPIDLSEIPF
jgi:single-strand DNA-binding protein